MEKARKEKKGKFPIKEWEKARKEKKGKFPIKEWEKAKKEGKKVLDQRTRRNVQKGLLTRQYLNNTELSPNDLNAKKTGSTCTGTFFKKRLHSIPTNLPNLLIIFLNEI